MKSGLVWPKTTQSPLMGATDLEHGTHLGLRTDYHTYYAAQAQANYVHMDSRNIIELFGNLNG